MYRVYFSLNFIWQNNVRITYGLFTCTADHGLLRAFTLIKHPQITTHRLSKISPDVNIFFLHEII